jgi:hypothetical protein
MDADVEYGFEFAIDELKKGSKVARQGWNGKGMFLWLQKGSACSLPGDRFAHMINQVGAELFELGDHDTETRMPCLCMRAADGSIVTGWLASQTDLLAEDWMIVE